MISCDQCQKWYHPACIGIMETCQNKLDQMQIICTICQQKNNPIKFVGKDLITLESKDNSFSNQNRLEGNFKTCLNGDQSTKDDGSASDFIESQKILLNRFFKKLYGGLDQQRFQMLMDLVDRSEKCITTKRKYPDELNEQVKASSLSILKRVKTDFK